MAITKLVSASLGTGVGGSLVKLNTTTVSSPVAQVDFDSTLITSDYDHYKIIGYAAPSSDDQFLEIRLSNSGTFAAGASDYSQEAAVLGASNYNNDNTNDSIETTQSGCGNDTDEKIEFNFDILNPLDTSTRTFISGFTFYKNNGGFSTGSAFAGHRLTLQANDGIRLFFTTGNIASGKFTLYGVSA